MPADVDAVAIPAGIAVLLAGTVLFVTVITALARIGDRLIDLAIGLWPRSAPRRAVRRRPGRFAGTPRTVVAAVLAGSLLFALAWSTFVLGRARDLS